MPSDSDTTKMTAAEAVDFLNVWGETELKKVTSQTTEARDTETAIDVLIEAVKDGTIRPDRAWTMSMLALIRRREKQDAENAG